MREGSIRKQDNSLLENELRAVIQIIGIAGPLHYFTHFHREEIAQFLTGNGFESLCLERRTPLEGEVSIPRIIAIGEKQ
jgi:hypothetical protein